MLWIREWEGGKQEVSITYTAECLYGTIQLITGTLLPCKPISRSLLKIRNVLFLFYNVQIILHPRCFAQKKKNNNKQPLIQSVI